MPDNTSRSRMDLVEMARKAAEGRSKRAAQGLPAYDNPIQKAKDNPKSGSGLGLAVVAAIATARAGEGGVRVEKLSAVVDIGRIINLDIAQQQVEGGLLQGLALAVGSGLNFAAGVPQETRLSALNLPSLSDAPIVEVEFIESDAPPNGTTAET